MTSVLTLGAEEELHLIDLESWKLVGAGAPAARPAAARELLRRDPAHHRGDQHRRRRHPRRAAGRAAPAAPASWSRWPPTDGVGIAAVGTAPSSAFADFELTTTGRYGRMQEQYRLLVDEQLICGLQIHVGVTDRDLAVEIMQRIARDLPVLLALSASSPYWNEQDTGYASIRSHHLAALAHAPARPARSHSAAEYDDAARRPDPHRRDRRRQDGLLRRPAVLARPDPGAAHLRRLPAGRRRDPDRRAVPGRRPGRRGGASRPAGPFAPVPPPLHRAAMWRAARSGLTRRAAGRQPPPPAAARPPRSSRALVSRLRPQLVELGDWDEVTELAASTRWPAATRPTGSGPPYAERGRLDDVVELVVAETHGPAGGPPPAMPALRALPRPGGRRGGRRRPAAAAGVPATWSSFFRGLTPDELRPRGPGRATAGWTRARPDASASRASSGASRSTWCPGSISAARVARRWPPGWSSGPGRSRRSCRTSTARSGSCADGVLSRDLVERLARLARRGAGGCRPAPCGRR